MKITNQSARPHYIEGVLIAPGATKEVDDKWKKNKTIQAHITKGELRIAGRDEPVTKEATQPTEESQEQA